MKIPWSRFFDIDSLRRHVPVMELADWMKGMRFSMFFAHSHLSRLLVFDWLKSMAELADLCLIYFSVILIMNKDAVYKFIRLHSNDHLFIMS